MSEWRLFTRGTVPSVSTVEFHRDRPRAPHLEQPAHRPRILAAATFVADAVAILGETTVSDLGCGDGGLLSLVQSLPGVRAWGYDFQPSNAVGWVQRHVDAHLADVFGADRDSVELGSVVVLTEVLEHIADPHGVMQWLGEDGRVTCIVASSPWGERPMVHDECHCWAWDAAGYADLMRHGGFTVLRHEPLGPFQLLLAVKT